MFVTSKICMPASSLSAAVPFSAVLTGSQFRHSEKRYLKTLQDIIQKNPQNNMDASLTSIALQKREKMRTIKMSKSSFITSFPLAYNKVQTEQL